MGSIWVWSVLQFDQTAVLVCHLYIWSELYEGARVVSSTQKTGSFSDRQKKTRHAKQQRLIIWPNLATNDNAESVFTIDRDGASNLLDDNRVGLVTSGRQRAKAAEWPNKLMTMAMMMDEGIC